MVPEVKRMSLMSSELTAALRVSMSPSLTPSPCATNASQPESSPSSTATLTMCRRSGSDEVSSCSMRSVPRNFPTDTNTRAWLRCRMSVASSTV
ncbi:Uncharacterised protein [Mycobacteroides abscessus subsp. abscessus]|nr:Uncharacterised protein [Mycobacteroides abscessus subsp. abscessus]